MLYTGYLRYQDVASKKRSAFYGNQILINIEKLNDATGNYEPFVESIFHNDGQFIKLEVIPNYESKTFMRCKYIYDLDQEWFWFPETKTYFTSKIPVKYRSKSAVFDVLKKIPRPTIEFVAIYKFFPLISGLYWDDTGLNVYITTGYGSVAIDFEGKINYLETDFPYGNEHLKLTIEVHDTFTKKLSEIPSQKQPKIVHGAELDKCIESFIRLETLQFFPKNDEKQGYIPEIELSGNSYEMGYQHGKRLQKSIINVRDRTIFGKGFQYAVRSGEWFLWYLRQKTDYIIENLDKNTLNELKGIADGAGITLVEAVMINQFAAGFHSKMDVKRDIIPNKPVKVFISRYPKDGGLQDEMYIFSKKMDDSTEIKFIGFAGMITPFVGFRENEILYQNSNLNVLQINELPELLTVKNEEFYTHVESEKIRDYIELYPIIDDYSDDIFLLQVPVNGKIFFRLANRNGLSDIDSVNLK